MRTTLILLTGASLLVTGCRRQVEVGSAAPSARATVRNAGGAVLGDLSFTQTAGGVRITGTLSSLPAGTHGIHLHAIGRCEPNAFTSAGGHLNPAGLQHGLENPAGAHAGDMPNITADVSGRAVVDITTNRVTLDATGALFDADGTAIVVHAAADDQKSDPAGNAGARIGCGVVARP